MLIVGLLSWWYGAGWRRQLSLFREHVAQMLDYFSIDLLLKTIFSPFKQISAGHVDGPISVQFRAFTDRLISRVIGGFVRIMTIFIGIVAIVFSVLWNLIVTMLWLVLPLLPFVCIALAITGWMPWR